MRFNDLVVIVLAGNDENPDFLGGIGQASKVFLPFGDGLVGDCVLRAVDGLNCCKAIYLVVHPSLLREHPFTTRRPLHLAPQGETRTGSMMSGVRAAREQGDYADGDHVMVISGDLPCLSSRSLERFLEACRAEGEADLYLGMVPEEAVSPELRPTYRRDFMPFRGGRYLHSEVYLLRPVSFPELGRQRFEDIMRIRRADLNSPREVLEAAITIIKSIGLRAIPPFVRTVTGVRSGTGGDASQDGSALGPMEKLAVELVEARLGPKMALVPIDEPGVALEFDHLEQLKVLERYMY
jgi:molybdopterin-guanine dinucleotide biosynthesis protein A